MAMLDMGSALGSVLGYGTGGGGGMENSSIAGAGCAGGAAGGGIDNQKLMAALGSIKGMAPVSPIMSGGVSGGGQPAPQANLAALQSNPLMAALMGMIQQGGAGARQVPGLGQLLRGGLMRV